MSELKPCPFCGGEAELVDCEAFFYVRCSNHDECKIFVITEDMETKEDAIAIWNRRAET